MRKTTSFSTSNRTVVRLIVCCEVLGCFVFQLSPSLSTSFALPAADPAVWSLVWTDEFNGPDGSAVDQSKWTAEIGGWGWGNNELEYYTARTDNAYQSGGSLIIKAIKERYTGADNVTRDYTSARLITKNKFTATYGRFEARIKVPYGQGIWPAFWLLGSNIDSVGWPQCGEVDIMENIGREPSVIHGAIHGPGYSGGNGLSSSYTLSNNQRFTHSFHTFAVEWEPNVIRFYCDGILYKTRTPADLPQGHTWVFNHPFFILLNVAVGGTWPGNPDGTTVFPQAMQVDYVRVYQRLNATFRRTSLAHLKAAGAYSRLSSSSETCCTESPCTRGRRRAKSTRMRRINCAETPKKCARLSKRAVFQLIRRT